MKHYCALCSQQAPTKRVSVNGPHGEQGVYMCGTCRAEIVRGIAATDPDAVAKAVLPAGEDHVKAFQWFVGVRQRYEDPTSPPPWPADTTHKEVLEGITGCEISTRVRYRNK